MVSQIRLERWRISWLVHQTVLGETLTYQRRIEIVTRILSFYAPTTTLKFDNNPEKWPVELLRTAKSDHEQWVSERLDKGLIFVSPVDNRKFIDERLQSWIAYSAEKVWLAVSINPLRIEGESVNPLDPGVVITMNEISVPTYVSTLQPVNRYHTRPNENGLINEDLRRVNEGYGYRIQIFRSGHCEILLCLQGSVDQITSVARERNPNFGASDRMVRYTDLAESVKAGIETLHIIWNRILPFKDVTLSVYVLNARRCFLYSREDKWGETVQGHPVESEILRIQAVTGRNESAREAFDSVIKQFVNYFGLILSRSEKVL